MYHQHQRPRPAPMLILGLIAIAGCGSSGKSGAEDGATPGDDAGLVESRSGDATLVVPDRLAVEIASDVVPPRQGMDPVAAWDVTPRQGDPAPETLTLRFDPARVDPERLSAWARAPDGSWELLPARIDPAAGRATVRAEHYSLYAWYTWSDASYQLEYYAVRLADGAGQRHPSHGHGDPTYLRFALVYPRAGGDAIDRTTIDLVEDELRRATKVYFDQGYRLPQTGGFFADVYAVLEVSTSNSESAYSAKPTQGHIELPIAAAADPAARAERDAKLRHDVAHELFHAVEDQYYSWPTMTTERWFVEAAAECAAAEVTGPRGIGPIYPNFAAMALDTADDGHMYASGHFLRWLARSHGFSLRKLLEQTDRSTDRLVTSLDQAVGNQLGQRLRDFLAWVWFDQSFLTGPDAPREADQVSAWRSSFGQPTYLPFQLRGSGRPVGDDWRETDSLTVPGPYGALLWQIQAQIAPPVDHRVLVVEIADGLPPLLEVCLYRVPGDARRPGGITPMCMASGDTRSPPVRVQAGDSVYVLLLNELGPRELTVRVGDDIDPSRTRVQPLGIGDLALTVPEWLVAAKDSKTALTLTGRVAPGFTSLVALPFPGADIDQLGRQFQSLMQALQQPGMVPAHSDPKLAYDVVEVMGRKVPLRRVTFTATGSWDSDRVRQVDATGRQSIRRRGDPWSGQIEYQALFWRQDDLGLLLVARGDPADRATLRTALLSLHGGAATPPATATDPETESCDQKMLAERIAFLDQRHETQLAVCQKDPVRPLACRHAIEGGLYRDYANSLDASHCPKHDGYDADGWRCLFECSAKVSMCLDQGQPQGQCSSALAPCRAACAKAP